MLRKLFLVAIIAANLALAAPALAQVQQPPEFNPLCWKCRECRDTYAKTTGKRVQSEGCSTEYFVSEDPCMGGDGDNQWGKCIPAGAAKTSIGFGGRTSFESLGEFILKNYNFAITVAAILAVLVIVMSGFQWTMSGGNSETIATAKHRITNSVIGLFIAYSSYFILSTINPELVNLRLPSAYMIRPFEEVPKFCSMLKKIEDKNKKVFKLASPMNEQSNKLTPPEKFGDYELSYNEIVGPDVQNNCGARYYFDGGADVTCFGGNCGGGRICTDFHVDNIDNPNYDCETASIVGKVVANYVIEPFCGVLAGYKFPYLGIDSFNDLFRVCQNTAGTVWFYRTGTRMETFPVTDRKFTGFRIAPVSNLTESCANENEKYLGYALGLYLVRNCNGNDRVLVNKFGYSLGETKKNGEVWWISNGNSYNSSSFFSVDDLKMGQRMIIDVSGVVPLKD